MRIGSTFSGAGGLDMAVEWLWPDAEVAWFCENDPHASAVYSQHWDAPNLGDITEVPWSEVEPVDVVVGGFPCQDISTAGKGAGIEEGTRSGLWHRLEDAVCVLRPRLVLLENVARITTFSGALDVVLGGLAEIGFDTEWGCLRASDVGAPHRRNRWFCVAWPATDAECGPAQLRRGPGELLGPESRIGGAAREQRSGDAAGCRSAAPRDPHGTRSQGRTPVRQRGREQPVGSAGVAAGVALLPTPTAGAARGARSATSTGRSSDWQIDDIAYADRWGEFTQAIHRWEYLLGRPAPAPTDGERRLSPDFVEWMMGWPEGWTDVGLSRSQRLKALGNGVVPQQAVHAYQQLLGRMP